jgi:hypothetical protein
MDPRQHEISKDLDSYIKSKRKTSWLSFFAKKQEATETEEQTGEEMVEVQTEQPAIPAEEQPVQSEPKKGLWSRIFGQQEQETGPVVEEAPPVDADLRDVAQCTFSFLRVADPQALAKIKESPEFAKFKDILKRRNIIK